MSGQSQTKTYGEALADPESNLARFVAEAESARQEIEAEVDRRMAGGLTHVEAWSAVLAETRP